jgi:myo-inositol 2-dehydrogenase/D-chiro-inositol 1-dehydrogenase
VAKPVTTENPHQATCSTASAIQRDLIPLNFFMDRYPESFVCEAQAFVHAVLQNKPTPVNGMDGRIAVLMGSAARKSHAEHRPVRLEEIAQPETLLA